MLWRFWFVWDTWYFSCESTRQLLLKSLYFVTALVINKGYCLNNHAIIWSWAKQLLQGAFLSFVNWITLEFFLSLSPFFLSQNHIYYFGLNICYGHYANELCFTCIGASEKLGDIAKQFDKSDLIISYKNKHILR